MKDNEIAEKTKKIEKKMGSFLKDFRDFAVKGNVVDMTVGVVIGTAFSKIVTSLVNDVIMPLFSTLISEINFSDLAITLKPGTETTEAILFKYGSFLQTMVDFLIIAFFTFLVIRIIGKVKSKLSKKEAAEAAAAEPPKPSDEVLLLTEIRDLLKKENGEENAEN